MCDLDPSLVHALFAYWAQTQYQMQMNISTT